MIWFGATDVELTGEIAPVVVVDPVIHSDWKLGMEFWAEVLNIGGYDVLAKPFREPEVRHTLEWALRLKASPAPPRVFVAGAVSY